MKYIEHHIKEVELIFEQYKGQEPLHLFIKKYFKKHKKFGSKDRKNISECLFGVFRMGRENRHLSIRERIYFFLFLKGAQPASFFDENFNELLEYYELDFEQKLAYLQETYELRKTFRTQEEISEEIDSIVFRNSFFKEPAVFIKLRNGSKNKYAEIIAENGGTFLGDEIVSFPSQVKLNNFFEPKDFVVQDLNSQHTLNYFPKLKKGDQVWDCCAGSGGKSILLLDNYPEVLLSVTDIRASILRSLITRFKQYGLSAELIAEANVNKAKDLSVLEEQRFDFILCDAPCTGSGTWARNPEQCYYFEKKELNKFQKRQLNILENTIPFLKQEGELLYITCSVFAKENEDVVKAFLEKEPSFKCIQSAYLDGTKLLADTLFIARFKRV